MTKQEFLAVSLPYGLKCQTDASDEICRVIAASFGSHILFRVAPENQRDFPVLASRIIPIVRHLDSLVKECVQKDYNNGKPFVPIVELAKMVVRNGNEDLCSLYHFENFYIEGEYVVAESNMSKRIIFNGKSFWVQNGYGHVGVIDNQLQLFQQLIKWHFDLFGGIESGEAIDVNTLKINLYK